MLQIERNLLIYWMPAKISIPLFSLGQINGLRLISMQSLQVIANWDGSFFVVVVVVFEPTLYCLTTIGIIGFVVRLTTNDSVRWHRSPENTNLQTQSFFHLSLILSFSVSVSLFLTECMQEATIRLGTVVTIKCIHRCWRWQKVA